MAAGPFALRLGPRLAAPAVASATRGGGRGSDRPTASRALVSKKSNKDHRLWIRKDSAGSGKKALCLVNTVSKLPNERETVYGALDRWTAFESEFPIIAAAKALEMLKKQRKWLQIIQVTKWLMSKGQVLTWTMYDTLLLALSMDGRVDEAESIWNTILQTYTRSVPKKLFSRMIQIYNTRHLPDKVLEIYADMEELGVRPDEDTTRRIGRAFATSGQEDKQKPVLEKHLKKWKYIHFNGERVRVRRAGPLA
ncbi:pentatricopeptide repeat-containing protein At4g18975, chloroplastic-like isoform X1 [Triticum dicoccoides]|uniref:pentatricopeptide repeat-containing protein At4g18975, chloroplastic-like isoform X1 n=1 Tax=Triticum dicoccoides TaxID=85692 RepID=UPI00188F4247|nr:pentatricopeptide repeat-containing protein At4g18975, chloroplastic-like isoform X1 [Triticum dicoccoides]